MKRFIVMALAVSLVVVGSYVVWAQPSPPERMCTIETCPVCRMTAQMMTHGALFVTEEMGVVVLVGDRLMRFDAGLNKIGETEIGIDLDQMERRLLHRLQNCPLHVHALRVQQVTMGQDLLPAPPPLTSGE